jgi:hypothetical protein
MQRKGRVLNELSYKTGREEERPEEEIEELQQTR